MLGASRVFVAKDNLSVRGMWDSRLGLCKFCLYAGRLTDPLSLSASCISRLIQAPPSPPVKDGHWSSYLDPVCPSAVFLPRRSIGYAARDVAVKPSHFCH